MAKTVREKDWAATPLGPIENWPQSLRTTISLCLASTFPISIAWGPHRVQIYNDGYWPICGAKHPHSMGQDFKECWFSAWPAIGEAFEIAQRGETSYLENQRMFLDRNGYLEETFFTFSFSPIRDESGGVGGLFHPVTETTANMLTARRTRCLRDLAARSAKAQTVADACSAVMQVLSENSLDLPFGIIYLFENDSSEELRLAASFGVETGFPDRGASRLHEALKGGHPLLVEGVDALIGGTPPGPYPEPPLKAFILPLAMSGVERSAGALVVGLSSRLPLDEAYRGYCELLGKHVETAIASARAYEDAQHKAEVLAELDRAKTAFFSNVSHEFRTPLTLMLAPMEEILARSDIPDPIRAELDRVHRNGLRLLKLVNTLLDFSRIEAGRAQATYEPTDLAALTADLASAFQPALEQAGLTFTVDCPPLGEPVFVDSEMWEKIVLNLVSNAFKFTHEGSVVVRLRLKEKHVELTVEDTGIGIEPENLPRVFERFHRVKGAQSRTHEGTGIGLALVEDLVRLQGGTIGVESIRGKGTVFTVRIPRGKGHLAEVRIHHGTVSTPARLGTRPYLEEALRWLPDSSSIVPVAPLAVPAPGAAVILLADDNADMRGYLTRILAERYIVHAAVDGAEALAIARTFRVDLVLSDVMMPKLDGFALLRHLRSDPHTRATPIILLSARAGEEARVEGLNEGADDYLVKPFVARELLARIDSQLRMARLRSETAVLQQSEFRFRTIADCAPVMIWTSTADGRCDYFNRLWLAFTGSTLEEECAQGWTANIDPLDRARCVERFNLAEEKRTSFDLEFRLLSASGETRWIAGSGTPRLLEGHIFAGYIFSCSDIDDRVQAVAALRASQTRLQLALDAANEGLWEWDVRTGNCFFGPRFYSIIGYTPAGIASTYAAWAGLIHPDDLDLAKQQRAEQVERRNGAFAVEYRLLTGSGVYAWVQSRGKVVEWTEDGGPARVVGTITDITEWRKLQDQFHEAQRLESIGQLAGGVAHDFNNLLTVINGYAEMLEEDLRPDDPLRAGVVEIRTAGERASDLTRQLLAFSRKQLLQTEVMNLNDVVAEAATMLRRLITENIVLNVRTQADLGNITADPGQIHQIIVNLAVNSRDAMPHGGTLLIETMNIDLDASYVDGHPDVPSGSYVLLVVTDTGVGIPPEVLAHIYEPFFTTKPKGVGTGLGLATVYGIVRQMNGWIWVYSEPGRGTSFKLYFQRTHERPFHPAVVPIRNLRGSESILIVEDQSEVRNLAVAALRRYGYWVHSVPDAAAAIAFCAADESAVDLVLTDVVLPGLNGWEMAQELARIRPTIRILFMSGYTDNAMTGQNILGNGVEYIQKPFTPEGLAEKIRQVLA